MPKYSAAEQKIKNLITRADLFIMIFDKSLEISGKKIAKEEITKAKLTLKELESRVFQPTSDKSRMVLNHLNLTIYRLKVCLAHTYFLSAKELRQKDPVEALELLKKSMILLEQVEEIEYPKDAQVIDLDQPFEQLKLQKKDLQRFNIYKEIKRTYIQWQNEKKTPIAFSVISPELQFYEFENLIETAIAQEDWLGAYQYCFNQAASYLNKLQHRLTTVSKKIAFEQLDKRGIAPLQRAIEIRKKLSTHHNNKLISIIDHDISDALHRLASASIHLSGMYVDKPIVEFFCNLADKILNIAKPFAEELPYPQAKSETQRFNELRLKLINQTEMSLKDFHYLPAEKPTVVEQLEELQREIITSHMSESMSLVSEYTYSYKENDIEPSEKFILKLQAFLEKGESVVAEIKRLDSEISTDSKMDEESRHKARKLVSANYKISVLPLFDSYLLMAQCQHDVATAKIKQGVSLITEVKSSSPTEAAIKIARDKALIYFQMAFLYLNKGDALKRQFPHIDLEHALKNFNTVKARINSEFSILARKNITSPQYEFEKKVGICFDANEREVMYQRQIAIEERNNNYPYLAILYLRRGLHLHHEKKTTSLSNQIDFELELYEKILTVHDKALQLKPKIPDWDDQIYILSLLKEAAEQCKEMGESLFNLSQEHEIQENFDKRETLLLQSIRCLEQAQRMINPGYFLVHIIEKNLHRSQAALVDLMQQKKQCITEQQKRAHQQQKEERNYEKAFPRILQRFPLADKLKKFKPEASHELEQEYKKYLSEFKPKAAIDQEARLPIYVDLKFNDNATAIVSSENSVSLKTLEAELKFAIESGDTISIIEKECNIAEKLRVTAMNSIYSGWLSEASSTITRMQKHFLNAIELSEAAQYKHQDNDSTMENLAIINDWITHRLNFILLTINKALIVHNNKLNQLKKKRDEFYHRYVKAAGNRKLKEHLKNNPDSELSDEEKEKFILQAGKAEWKLIPYRRYVRIEGKKALDAHLQQNPSVQMSPAEQKKYIYAAGQEAWHKNNIGKKFYLNYISPESKKLLREQKNFDRLNEARVLIINQSGDRISDVLKKNVLDQGENVDTENFDYDPQLANDVTVDEFNSNDNDEETFSITQEAHDEDTFAVTQEADNDNVSSNNDNTLPPASVEFYAKPKTPLSFFYRSSQWVSEQKLLRSTRNETLANRELDEAVLKKDLSAFLLNNPQELKRSQSTDSIFSLWEKTRKEFRDLDKNDLEDVYQSRLKKSL